MTKHELIQLPYLSRELKLWEKEYARIKESEHKQELLQRIESKRLEIQRLRDSALLFISDIPDSLLRMVVYHRCISCMTWRRIAFEVGGFNTPDSVRMMFARFMKSGQG